MERIFIWFENSIGVINIGNQGNFDQRIFFSFDIMQTKICQSFGNYFRCRTRRCHTNNFEKILRPTTRSNEISQSILNTRRKKNTLRTSIFPDILEHDRNPYRLVLCIECRYSMFDQIVVGEILKVSFHRVVDRRQLNEKKQNRKRLVHHRLILHSSVGTVIQYFVQSSLIWNVRSAAS